MVLRDDMLMRQIRDFTAALLRLKTTRVEDPLEVLDDLGELFRNLFGLQAKIALGLDPQGVVALLSPGDKFDPHRAAALVDFLRLQAQARAAAGDAVASRRHHAQIAALEAELAA